MKLEYLMTYRATLKPGLPVGPGPYGTRTFGEVTGGTFEGPRLKGSIASGGGDWILVDANGMGHVDVRAILSTEDGANIYVQYFGSLELNDAVRNAFANQASTDFGDCYFMTAPRFETGDPRYAWLNDLVAVAEGRIREDGVEYRAYAVVND